MPKGKLIEISESLKILWQRLSVKFYFAFYVLTTVKCYFALYVLTNNSKFLCKTVMYQTWKSFSTKFYHPVTQVFFNQNFFKGLNVQKFKKKHSSLKGSELSYYKKLFSETTTDKLFEKNFRLHVKKFAAGKVKYPDYLLILTKYLFYYED